MEALGANRHFSPTHWNLANDLSFTSQQLRDRLDVDWQFQRGAPVLHKCDDQVAKGGVALPAAGIDLEPW